MNFLVPVKPAPRSKPSNDVVLITAEDYRRAGILQNFRPSYWSAVGLATAVLHKLTRLHNGEVGAHYDLKITNPQTSKRESTRYLYGVDARGAPKELKKLSTLVS